MLTAKRGVSEFAWAIDGAFLYVLAPDEPADEDERREKDRDDADVYGERTRPHRLRRVAAAGGEPQLVWEADRHVLEVAVSPDERRLAVVATDTPEEDERARGQLWLIDAPGEHHREPRQVATGVFLRAIGWADADTVVYVTSQRPDSTSAHTIWAQTGDEPPRVIGPGIDEPRCALDVRPVAAGGRVAILVAEGLESRLEWCDPATGQREPLWVALGSIAAFDVGPGPVIAAVAHGAGGNLEVLAGPPARLTRRSYHQRVLDEMTLGRVVDFTFTGVDGTPLDGILIRSSESALGPAPTVVLLHGGPYGRSERNLQVSPLNWGQLLATAGYTVLLPNYRGGLGHGDEFAAAARGGMGTVEWSDVLAAVDAAVERGVADPDRLGIGGWSQGGFLTAWAITHTDRFQAAVMGAGVSDWGVMAMTSDLPTFEAELGGDTPWDGVGPHAYAKASPISYAASRSTPLLIVHGQEDVRVPVSQATGFHRSLRRQDAALELVTYPREPHGIRERAHQVDLQRRVLDWFNRYLLPIHPETRDV